VPRPLQGLALLRGGLACGKPDVGEARYRRGGHAGVCRFPGKPRTLAGIGSPSGRRRDGASVWKMKEISRHKSTDVPAGCVRAGCSSSMRPSGCIEGSEMADCFGSFGLIWRCFSTRYRGSALRKSACAWLIALMVMCCDPLAMRSITSETTFGP
jgi:hypothetical protein